MGDEGQCFWNLEILICAAVLKELEATPATELREIMAYMALFEAKRPEKVERIRKPVDMLITYI